MKKLLLLSALALSGLANAAEALPEVVKNFSEQQGIKILKKKSTRRAVRRRGWGSIRTWA